MTTQAQAVILTKEHGAAQLLASALEGQDEIGSAGVYRDLVSLMASLDSDNPAVVVVDMGFDPMGMLDALEPVVNNHVQSRFVVLADELTAEVVMRAMQIGVRHVQRKSTADIELPEVLRRLARGVTHQATQLGKLYTVLSAGGGCGATTVAVNLANELQLATSEAALLVDLDFAYGAIATYLDIRSRYGIADIFRHTGTIDSHLVRSTAALASERLYALLSPASIDLADATTISLPQLEQTAPALRHAYGHTVVDAPRVSMDIAEVLVKASEYTFVIMQPAVKDVRHAKSIMTELTRRGVSADRLRAVLNRHRKRRQMISVEDTQKALGNYSLVCLSNDYSNVIESINYGKPLSEAAPRSALRREVVELAAHAAGLTNGRSRG